MYCVFVFHTKLSIDELNIEKSIHNYGFLKRQKSQFEHTYQIQQLLENFQLTTRGCSYDDQNIPSTTILYIHFTNILLLSQKM